MAAMTDNAALEQRARHVARRVANGFFIDLDGRRRGLYRAKKSRERTLHANNHGGFMIVNVYSNGVVAGANYDLSAEDVIKWFEEEGSE